MMNTHLLSPAIVKGERAAVLEIFSRWGGPEHGSSHPPPILEQVLEYLALLHREDEFGQLEVQQTLNAQLSVDTRRPKQLRLTLDPFAGVLFWIVGKQQLLDVLGPLASHTLTEKSLRLYRLGYALPQTFWVGVAPAPAGGVVKAYIASPEPTARLWLPHLARDADWLPPILHPTFTTLYDRLAPALAILEGIGVSFQGEVESGTTFYLRSVAPWTLCTTPAFEAFLGIKSIHSLRRLPELFPVGLPSTFGWSLECDPSGVLIDWKLEVALEGRYSYPAVATYAEQFGIDSSPFQALGDAIKTAGLSTGTDPAPTVLSLRYVSGFLESLVAYFQLSPMP